MTTCPIRCCFPFAGKTAPTFWGMDHWRCAVVSGTMLLSTDPLSCWKRPQPTGNAVSMKGCTWSATMLMLKETTLDAKDTTVFRNSKDGHWMVQAVHSSIISKPRSLRIRTCPLYTRATSLRCMWADIYEEKTLSFPVLCSGNGKNCQMDFWCRERLYENTAQCKIKAAAVTQAVCSQPCHINCGKI